MSDFIKSLILFLTIVLWCSTILTFFSKTFNEMIIKELKENCINIKKRNEISKKLLRKIFYK